MAFETGRSDDFSWQTCRQLLGRPEQFKVMEIIYGNDAVFTQHCIFVLCGAHYREFSLNGEAIEQNKVYEAHKEDVLNFKGLERGFRLYLMASPFDKRRVGVRRGNCEKYFGKFKRSVRVIQGPEFDFLLDPEELLGASFVISSNSDLSGLRLEGGAIAAKQYDIVSSIVDDGTIQLTPKGPIVLLRERQLTGGYPRVLSVAKADLDFLAQYRPGSIVRFELIGLDQAKALLLQRDSILQAIASPSSI